MAVDEQALADSIDALSGALHAVDGPPVLSLVSRLAEIVAAANELLGVDAVGVLLLDEVGMLRAVASSGAVAAALEQAQQRLGVGPGHDTLARNGSVLVADLTLVPAYRPLLAELDRFSVRAVLSAPIRIAAEVIGNLNLIRLDVHHWSQAEAQAAEAYAEVVGRLLQMGASTGSTEPGWDELFPAAAAETRGCERDADQR